jgi:hypothetical protein
MAKIDYIFYHYEMFALFRQLLPELRIEILSRVLESERDDIYRIVNESTRFKEANYNKK